MYLLQKKAFFLMIVFVTFFCFGCKKESLDFTATQDMAVANNFAVSAPKMMKASASPARAVAQPEMYSDSITEEAALETSKINTEDRKLIYNGYIRVQVENLGIAEEQCLTWCKNHNGYISNSNSNDRSINLTLRIPAKDFNTAINDISLIGKVEEKNINSQDVTERFYDLTKRLETRKILHERLLGYLKNSTKVEDMVKVERQINDVQSEIESMQGQLNRLVNQIDFCTLTVHMSLPPNTTEHGFITPNLSDDFKDLLSQILSFFEAFLLVIIKIIVFGIPIIILCALLYWVTFGKLGLVKKLFKKLHK